MSLLGLLMAASMAMPESAPVLWGGLEPGPYRTGFRTILRRDLGRSGFPSPAATGEPGRPMQVVVWYPTSSGGSQRAMPLAAYVHLQAQELDLGSLTDARARAAEAAFLREPLASGASAARLEALLATRTAALPDAPAAEGRFPLILFLHSAAPGESVMSEYLASHGFVVAAVASKGAFQPAYRLGLPDLEAMVDDAEYVLAMARELTFVSSGPVAVIGMSNGALGAIKLAMRNPEVKAIISLDGTIGERAAGTAIPKDPFYDLARINAPIVHFYNDDNAYLDLTTLRGWERSDRYLVRLSKLPHAALDRLAPGMLAPSPVDPRVRYEWLCRQALLFLDSTLRHHGSSIRDALTAAAREVEAPVELLPAVHPSPAPN